MHSLYMVCECQVQHFLSLHESEEVLYLVLDLVNNASIYKKVTGFSIFLLLIISANEVHKTSVTCVTREESRFFYYIIYLNYSFPRLFPTPVHLLSHHGHLCFCLIRKHVGLGNKKYKVKTYILE